MKRTGLAWFLFAGGFAFSAAAFGLSSQLDSLPSLMSRADFVAERRAIESESRHAIGRCRSIGPADDRALCKAGVKAGERVNKADLAARYYGTIAAARDAQHARVRASHDVARAQCGNRSGRERAACVAAARDRAGSAYALAASPAT